MNRENEGLSFGSKEKEMDFGLSTILHCKKHLILNGKYIEKGEKTK